MASCSSLNFTAISSKPQKLPSSSISSPIVQLPFTSHLSFSKSSSPHSDQTLFRTHCRKLPQPNGAGFVVFGCVRKTEPLRIMISGAPASGKGTQCELITQKGFMEFLKSTLYKKMETELAHQMIKERE